jgi:hypothetical protein
MKRNILYKGRCLRLAICARYSWETSLNAHLDYYSTTCSTGKEYGRKYVKFTV